MITTQDGHTLSIDDECFVVSLDENGEFIESSIPCIYMGTYIRDNKKTIDDLPVGCSGVRIPEIQEIHRFESVRDSNMNFDLLEFGVNNTVIRSLSSIRKVVKLKLRD